MLYKSVTAVTGAVLLSQSIQLVAEDISKIPEELLVTASRIEMPLRQIASSVSVLDRDDIEARGLPTAQDLLRSLPAINVSANGGMGQIASLRIRGEEAYRTRILVDGINLDDTTGVQHVARIEHILTNNIERIEVLRGAQGMMYGADAGGVINIITRRGAEGLAGSVSHEQGRYGYEQSSAELSGATGDFDFAASVTATDADGYNVRTSDTALRDRDGYENDSRSVRAGVQLNDEWRVNSALRNVKSRTEFDGCFNSVSFTTSHDCYGTLDQTNKLLSLERKGETTETRLTWQRADLDRGSYVDGGRGFEGSTLIEEWQWFGAFATDKGRLLGGIDYKEEAGDVGIGFQKIDLKRDQLGAYAEWQGSTPAGVLYTVGLRHDDNDDFGSFFTHRVTLARIFDRGNGNSLKLKGSHGTGFRAPSLYELSTNASASASLAGIDMLGPEETRSMDAGIEYWWGDRARVELVYFRQYVDSAYQFVNNFALPTFGYYAQTAGRSQSEGAELSADYTIIDGLRLIGNATYNDAKAPSGAPRVRRPRHLRNTGVEYRAASLPLTVFANMRFVEDAVDVGSVKLDDYEVLDINVNWKFSDNIEFWVRGENVLDEDYQETNGFRSPRAAVYSGARLRFN